MVIEDKKMVKAIAQQMAIVFGCIMACRFTGGLAALGIAAYGVWAGFNRKVAAAICCFIMFPFLRIVNPCIIAGGANGMILTLGLLVIAVGLCMSGSRRAGRCVLPVGSMVGYMTIAAVSSVSGYAPLISFMKLINFASILFGLWLGLKDLVSFPDDARRVRLMFLGMVSFLIVGSCITLAFPAYGYANDTMRLGASMSIQEMNDYFANSTGTHYFSGVTCQSQALAVILPCSIAWLFCDMLFVERRVSVVHISLICAGMPLIFMTRSRTALVTTAALVWMVYTYCLGKIPVKPKVKKAVQGAMMVLLGLVAIAAVAAEIKDQSVSRWLRKTDDVAADTRSMGEALTSSRMGLVEESLRDFKSNPLFGKGFQVAWYTPLFTGGRLVFSSPIEKGVLPAMILGETGALGALAFLVFLGAFYGTCVSRRYVVTATLFTAFLATNLGEASFFSPGGVGGMLWALCAGGGFVIDSLVIIQKRKVDSRTVDYWVARCERGSE